MAAAGWKPHESLTKAPTNLKEAIDWVLRVTGRDGKQNVAKKPPSTDNPPHCLCYLAKAVKDLLYDAGIQYSTESTSRDYTKLLLDQEQQIVQSVIQDLGLDGNDKSNPDGCGSTEVIGRLIDQLAQGLQKWVGWQEDKSGKDECCLNTDTGIGKQCQCPGGVGAGCCSPSGGSTTTCHDCRECGTSATSSSGNKKCYLSAYCKKNSTSGGSTGDLFLWTTISTDSTKVHLLARIFLGSVCLIWSGLSQLGFLTKEGSGGKERWSKGELSKETENLGSFMAAMGYDLDRLNQGSTGNGKTGSEVADMLSKAFNDVKEGANQDSVAEYYSTIYQKAVEAKNSTTESICKEYPLLVLHILASGYFRAGSAGANKVTPAKPATSDTKKENTPRKPRTIREILYWLSALPYSHGYKDLVGRMQQKTDQVTQGNEKAKQGQIELYKEGASGAASTTLQRKDITHYLMAACGYCPLVLIGIQGTIASSGNDTDPAASGSPAKPADPCPESSKKKEERTECDKDKKLTKEGKVCYGGYHLEVSKFGPLHGMYANGLFGFQMDGSPAQCLEQLRIYVYHCFYQLYFLRKQCKEGVMMAGGKGVALGWQSCRYGSGVSGSSTRDWRCTASGTGKTGVEHTKNCGLKDGAASKEASPLQSFLCDAIGGMCCRETIGVDLSRGKQKYPEIDAHMNKTVDSNGKQHEPHKNYPQLCPVPMGWDKDNHFKDLTQGSHKTGTLDNTKGSGAAQQYPAHCTGNTLSHLLEYYCDPRKSHGSLVVLLRLLACITPTVPRTLGDLFGFYYYVVNIIGFRSWDNNNQMKAKLENDLKDIRLSMLGNGGDDAVVKALEGWNTEDCNGKEGNLRCLVECTTSGTGQCCQYICPLTGEQYRYLAPSMAGTYLSWLVYLIENFEGGLKSLKEDYMNVDCKTDGCKNGQAGTAGCNGSECKIGKHGEKSSNQGVCCCPSVVSCTGVLPVLYKYGFGYGSVTELHKGPGTGKKQCHDFLKALESVLEGNNIKTDSKTGLHHEINQLIYTTRLPWIFVLTVAWLVAVLYLAFGAIWPLDWTHMRSHCRGWFRKGSLSPWEILMVGKKKGRGILEFFGGN